MRLWAGRETRQGGHTPIAIIVGHPRSVTTALGRLLASHPQVAYWEEPQLLIHARRWQGELRRLLTHLEADLASDVFDGSRGPGQLRKQTGVQGDQEKAYEMTDRLIATLLRDVIDEAVSRGPHSMLVEKTPKELSDLYFAFSLLPEAKGIHIIRDPRAILSSTLNWIQGKGYRKGRSINTEAAGWPPWLERTPDVPEVIARRWLECLDVASV